MEPISKNQVPGADPGFPLGGAPTIQEGAPTYEIAKIFEKLHEIEKILGRRPYVIGTFWRGLTREFMHTV